MIEVLKQAYQLLLTEPHAPTVCDQLEIIFRRAIAELESQEPVATVTSETGADITMSWWHEPALPVGTKLFTHPPQRKEPVDYEKLAALGWQAIECGICGGGAMGYPQRTWAGLTDDEIDTWNIVGHESLREFVRAIEAKLKEKNT